jgi:glycosyltransferase involved in cell wall biosynthesis
MTILHTLHWVQFAGTEKVCVDLCNELSKEHKVFLLTSKHIKPYINDEVSLVEVDFEKNRYNPLFLFKIANIIKKINPDVIHVHNTKELEVMYNARIFLKNKIPIIATKHTLTPKKKFALADLAVGILEETHSIINSNNSIIIKNGMAYKEPKILPKEEKFHIISAARLTPAKGMQTIIKALSLVKFDYKFSIFGQGEQKEELQNMIKELGLENNITIVGFVDNLNDYLASADVQIIASIFEPFGLTAIDGIYYSKVLISTNTGICADILDKDLIFENTPEALAEKLTEIHNNYNLYLEKFVKIKERKEDFSIEKMVEQYVQAYKSLIK